MNEPTTALTTLNNLTSSFLRLPAELRNKIYTFYFTGHTILLCFITTFWSRPSDPCPLYLLQTRRRISHMHYPRHLLAFANTCRQTHAETQLLPFSHSTFVGYPEALVATFPGRIRRLWLDCVRIVELPIQESDLFEERGSRALRLTWTMETALRVLRRLGGVRAVRVVWEGEILRGYPWEYFRRMLIGWVAGGIRRADVDVQVVKVAEAGGAVSLR